MSHPPVDQTRLAIRQLPTQLANQIAAGEVVERPASIVKELLENSIDAGASHITLTLDRGGLQLINVQDDGCGIPPDELALALASHATSKIYQAEDLAAISSMGFRGEALASIASVSRLSITSRTAEGDTAWQLLAIQGEQGQSLKPAAHPPGSSVRIEELFFNTPARRRFLRSERTEYRHCEDVVRRLVLSHFTVAFRLIHNNKTIFNFPVALDENAIRVRLQKFGGKQFTQGAIPLSYTASGLRLHGWVGTAALARPQSDLQFFFVNRRIIRDRLVSHALRQAYSNSIFPGRHPAYILFLEIDYAEVDVNVHPAKHEVRFHQARLVHDFLNSGVQHALHNVPVEAVSERQPVDYSARIQHESVVPDAININQTVAADYAPRPRETPSITPLERPVHYRNIKHQPAGNNDAPPNFLMYGRYGVFKQGAVWAILDINSYWYHEIKRTLLNDETRVILKPLLFPQTFDLQEPLLTALRPLLPRLKQLGLDFKLTEKNKTNQTQIILGQLPAVLDTVPVVEFVTDLFAQVAKNNVTEATLVETVASLCTSLLGKEANNEHFLFCLQKLRLSSADDLIWQHPAVKRLEADALQKMFESA